MLTTDRRRADDRATMAITNPDRRRILLATALTAVALPVLWWSSKSDDAAPNVATAGIAVGGASSPNPDPTPNDADTRPGAPVFLDGPTGQVGAGLAEIAVPGTTGDTVVTTAAFRNSLPATWCSVPGMLNGRTVTVVNLDNNRSVTCTTTMVRGNLGEQIYLHPDLFADIADLTDAPIPVEIRR